MTPHKMHRSATSAAVLFALLASLVSGAAPAGATVRAWNNASGGSAGTAGNWTPSGVPGSGDNLTFGLSAAFTVDFPATVVQVASHAYNGGFVTLTTSSPHTCTGSWSVGSLGTGTLSLSGANVKAGGLYVGNSSTDYGHLTITSTGGIPATSSRFETTDTTPSQDAIVANDGKARLEVFGGSQCYIGKNLILGNTTAARCTLSVAGRNNISFINSGLSLTNPRFGVLRAGLGGQAEVTVSNGGQLHVAGQASFGGQGTGVGHLTVSGTTIGAAAHFDGPLYVGGNEFVGTAGGSGSVQAGNRGSITAAGPVAVGDVDGGGASSATVLTGGQLIAAGGLSIQANGSLVLGGGVTNVAGGTFVPKPNGALSIGPSGGSGDAPELWVSTGHANTYVSNAGGIVIGGVTGATGTLRVTASGTTFGTSAHAPVSVGAASPAAAARLVVDSLATFEPSGLLDIAEGASAMSGTVSVTGGSHLNAAQVYVGNGNNSTASLTVMGPATGLQYTDRLAIGGAAGAAGSSATALVDSGAAVSGVVADSASPVVVVQSPQGKLTVSRGATLGAGSVRVLGTASTDGGTYNTALVSVLGSGMFGGHGVATGNVSSTGTTHAIGAPSVFGALRANGTFSQSSGAKLQLRLGHSGSAPVNDSLVVGGAATLNGVLALELDPSFRYVVGDTFTVVTYASHTGAFIGYTWNDNPGTDQAQILYTSTAVKVVIRPGSTGVGAPAVGELRFRTAGSLSQLAFDLELPSAADVRVVLFDVAGQRVATLAAGPLGAGVHHLGAESQRGTMRSGAYFARAEVRVDGRTEIRVARGVLVK